MADRKSAVGILFYNKPALTARCIRSVLDAGVPPQIVFAIDNGSQAEAVRQLIEEFPSVQFVRLEENSGYSGGFNAAARFVIDNTIPNLLFLTNDVLYGEGALEAFQEYEDADIQAPLIRIARDPDRIDSSGGYLDRKKWQLQHYREDRLPRELEPHRDYIPGTAMYISSKVLKKLGGMDTSYHTYWEDVDFSFRAHKSGYKLVRNDAAVLLHGVGKTCHKKPFYTLYLYQRNRLKFLRNHLPAEDYLQAKDSLLPELQSLLKKKFTRADAARRRWLEEIMSEYYPEYHA